MLFIRDPVHEIIHGKGSQAWLVFRANQGLSSPGCWLPAGALLYSVLPLMVSAHHSGQLNSWVVELLRGQFNIG